jgi:hypothetical protein
MPALDNIFMTAIAIIGAPLAIGSFIVDEEIAKTGCGGKDAHNYATCIMILSLVMCVVSIAFVVCKKKCDCKGDELDVSVYIGGGVVLSTILLYLSISLAKQIDFSKCTTAGNIVWFLVGSSATTLMICLGMAGYRMYSQSVKRAIASPSSSRRSPSLPPDSPTFNPAQPTPRRLGRPELSLSRVPFDMPSEEPVSQYSVESSLPPDSPSFDRTQSAPRPPGRSGLEPNVPSILQPISGNGPTKVTRSIANPIQPPQPPPWRIYNESPRSAMWQQGARRVHLEKFDDWYNSLNLATRREYLTQSSVPPLWSRYYLQYTLTD